MKSPLTLLRKHHAKPHSQQFSVADITAVVAVDFARIIKIRPDERHPHLLRWRRAMQQRPAVAL